MTKTKYINIIIGEDVYEVPAIDCPEADNTITARLGLIIVKLHKRVEELELTVDDIRSIVGYGDEL